MKLLLQSNGGFSGFYSKFILIDTDLHKMVKTDGLMKDGLTGIKYICGDRILFLATRRTGRAAGTLRPATGTATLLRTPTRSAASAPSLKS